MIGTLATKTIIENGVKKEVIDAIESPYKPSKAVQDLTERVKEDYQIGYEINNRDFEEFNDMSLIQRQNVDQKAWNGWVQAKSDDPDEDWRWNGVTDITRNKILLTAAHLTSGMMYPGTFAQNDQDEEDKIASYIMGDLMEWNITHSDYELTFMFGVIAALVNPVAYIHVDYADIKQTIKVLQANGTYEPTEVQDNVLSGFQLHNVPADEILIANPYEYHIQRQRFIIRKKWIDVSEAKAKYANHENVNYITAGTKVVFNAEDATFYEQYDDSIKTLVQEIIYYNRRMDAEIPFINGIYLGDANVKANRIRHRDNKNRPKYPYVKFGAEPIDEKRFWAYKSYSAKMANNQEVADVTWRLLIDSMVAGTKPPVVIIGGGEGIDSDFTYPGSIHQVDENTKVDTLDIGGNPTLASEVLKLINQNMSEQTQDPQRGGASSNIQQTKFQTGVIEQNAKIQLGIIGRMIVQMVRDIGELMVDDIVRYQTVGQIEEVTSDGVKMKYRNFLIPNKTRKGKQVTDKIIFDEKLIGKKMSKKKKLAAGYNVLQEEQERGGNVKLIRANPILFSRMNFLITLDADSWVPRNKRFEEIMNLERYDRAIARPETDHEALTRDILMATLFKADGDKYMLNDKRKIAEQMLEMQGKPSKDISKELKTEKVEAVN